MGYVEFLSAVGGIPRIHKFLAQVGGDMIILEKHVDTTDQLFCWKIEHAKSSECGMESSEAFCYILQEA